MTIWTLVIRSLRFHWRVQLGVLVGVMLSTAVLVGALAVGDSMRVSLRRIALARLGNVELALNTGNRFFRAQLAKEISSELNAPVAPIILLSGSAVVPNSHGRARGVQVVGVDERFWQISNVHPLFSRDEESIVVNRQLARELLLGVGDELLLRLEKPSLLPRDSPLVTVEDSRVTSRFTVTAVAGDADLGRFSLEANQVSPLTIFVPLNLLQRRINQPERVNGLLVGALSRDTENELSVLNSATAVLKGKWELRDVGLELRDFSGRTDDEFFASADLRKGVEAPGRFMDAVELRSNRVFIEPLASDAAIQVGNAKGVLAYVVNELRVGSRTTPYSLVAALAAPLSTLLRYPPESELEDDEIIVNAWLAEDLKVVSGDELTITYFVLGPMRQLKKESRAFRVRAVVALAGAAADPDLMPAIPGFTDSEHCRDWDPGIPIDLARIREKDERYWDKYHGTPKAFVTLAAGKQMWANRFGNLTAVRYATRGELLPSAIELHIKERLTPASMGLFFVPVRDQALAASKPPMERDLGILFLGFSIFIIVAALLLTALLFSFGVEKRAEEVGTFLAFGFRPSHVHRVLLLEGAVLAFFGGIAGVVAGVIYAKVIIRGLSTVWRDAIANTALQFHADPAILAGGATAGFVVALLTIWLVVRKQRFTAVRDLLAGSWDSGWCPRASVRLGRLTGTRTAVVAFTGALVLSVVAMSGDQHSSPGIFFGVGTFLILGGLAVCRVFFAWIERGVPADQLTLSSLGLRNIIRRAGRSMAAVVLLACGSFLVIAVGANRHSPDEEGTGRFSFYGETTLPIYHDIFSEEGREQFGLDASQLMDVSAVSLRVRPGDDASCLNLNTAQAPRLLGVQPEALNKRFYFTKSMDAPNDPWALLNGAGNNGVVPAVGDMNTVVWSLGKKLGDTIDYVDERGNSFQLWIVGILKNCILQGNLLISEGNFIERFPSQSGYQVFLIDADDAEANVADVLTHHLQDVGLSMMPTVRRLATFNMVENTYLSIFAALGGLGLLLGSVGLGVVVLRNVLERRAELALLRAVGFRAGVLRWLVFREHGFLLLLGLTVGVVGGLIATLPVLSSPAEMPFGSLTLTLGAVLINGFIWTWVATLISLYGPLTSSLRDE